MRRNIQWRREQNVTILSCDNRNKNTHREYTYINKQTFIHPRVYISAVSKACTTVAHNDLFCGFLISDRESALYISQIVTFITNRRFRMERNNFSIFSSFKFRVFLNGLNIDKQSGKNATHFYCKQNIITNMFQMDK